MATKHDWKKVGEIAEKVRELGLSYKDGPKRFGLKPWVLYDYNRKSNGEAEAPAKAEPGKDKASESTAASPVALPGDVGNLMRTYRREHPSHGFKRIQDLLKQVPGCRDAQADPQGPEESRPAGDVRLELRPGGGRGEGDAAF